MNIYALSTGIITVIFIVWHFKRTRLEKASLPYPLLLASFPFYYFAFALYAGDLDALYKEIFVSIIFFALVYAAIKSNRKVSTSLIALGCIAHAIYDTYHNAFFINPGTPFWWLEFCGSIDLILGIYLIYFAITTPGKLFKKSHQKSTAF